MEVNTMQTEYILKAIDAALAAQKKEEAEKRQLSLGFDEQ